MHMANAADHHLQLQLQDFSLSNLLGESPAKKDPPPATSGLMCESSRDSLASRFDVSVNICCRYIPIPSCHCSA